MPLIDARPYALVLRKLVADGAKDRDIAERIGFSSTAVRYIRTGRTRWVRHETAQAIAALLGIS